MTLLDELADHRIGLGTAGFAFGAVSASAAVEAMVVAVRSGAKLIDSARAYTRAGEAATAETLVGAALRHVGRDNVLVSTKGGHWRSGDEFPIDGGRRALRDHCAASLRALGVDEIDLYQLHHVDPRVPLAESVAALAELQAEGAVRRIGLSNVTSQQLAEGQRITDIAAVQNRLSLDVSGDAALARQCVREGIAYLAYSPLGGVGAEPSPVVARVAARHGVSPQRLLLAWALAQSPAVIPLVGATRPATIQDSLAATEVQLTRDDLEELGQDHPSADAAP